MPENADSREFLSADEFGIVSDNNKSGKISSENSEIQISDEWSTSTNNLSGSSELINDISISTIWDFPVNNVYLNEEDNLFFQDDNIVVTDDSGCPLDDGVISLAELTGDVDLLKEFDRINTFGKIFDIQFRDITHGEYKYANTQICNIVSTSMGFMSLDKLINDERSRQVRQDALHTEFEGTDDEAFYPAYSGFLVSDAYVNEGWINFDQAIHDRLDDEFGFDGEASVSIKTKKFQDTKRVLVNMALTYASSIPVLQSNNKITDFGVRIVDRTTDQQLDLSNFKNDGLTEYGNSGTATFAGKLEYVLPTDIDEEVTCDPCGKYKIIRCEGTIYREESCDAVGDLGVSHELAPQFRLNPIIETRTDKKDILNTIDPIHWTGGTQTYTEEEWKGITTLRNEFGADNLHVGKLNESRAFHYADGDIDSGFAVGGFFHDRTEAEDEVAGFSYGSRVSTEIWDGKDWVSTDYTLSTSRSAGLGGGDGTYNVIAYGTKGTYDVPAEDSFVSIESATPVPSFFVTNYETSKTEIMDTDASMNWTPADCNTHTNVPRHSVAGILSAVKQFTTVDGQKLESNTINNTAATPFTLSKILGEDIAEEDDVTFNLPNNIFNTLSSFVRDSARRASGKGVATSLKLIGPAFNPDDALLGSKDVPYVQDSDDQVATGSFSQKTKGAMDFIIKKNTGTSDNYNSGTSIDIPDQVPSGLPSDLVCTAGVSGLNNLADSVEAWEHPIRLDDNTIIFVDKSGQVDTDLLKEGQSVDNGDWYEMYNVSGIAFNGSTGDLEIVDINDSDLSDTFEYFSYVKFIHHSTKRKTGTAYENVTFTFEHGSFTIDPNRKYPIKTVGTCFVGNEVSGLATGGKTSNQIAGCDDNAALNIKYGYFSDDRYDEFKNSIVNVSYELNGDAWIRRDNLPENVAFHAGVGDEKHALFWGGLHGTLELPDVVASFPGCDDWDQAIKSFGGVFNIRGNKGLDSEDRYTFFSTRHVDEFGNEYYKAGDYRYDLNQYGVDYSDEYLAEYDSQITTKWSEDLDRAHGHIYSATYPTSADDMFVVNYYVNGQAWIGDLSLANFITDVEGIASREHSDQVGTWLKEFMDNDLYHEYFSSYRPDTDDNSLNGGNETVNADGIYPTKFNYFLNDFENRSTVWKYSGHPVDGPMWIWSRPTPGEELFDPRSIHAAPTETGEWQSEATFDKHSFQEHIGYESFFTRLDEEYDDLLDDTSFATKIVKDQIKTVYWVMDVYDDDSQETYSTLYDYDVDKVEKFYDDFEDYTDSNVAWQHFLSREAGRARVRSEDTRYRIEYISDLDWLDSEGPLTIIKQGTLPIPVGELKSVRVSFLSRLPEFLDHSTNYGIRVLDTDGGIIEYLDFTGLGPTGFTVNFPEDTVIPSINWRIVIDVRQDFIEMYHHGINKNMNQNHGIPLSALAKEFRAYFEDQDTTEVNLFTVAHMQNLLDVNYRLGNIDLVKLAPPYMSHVPEEALTVPVSSSKFAPTPLDVTFYQDVFTNPDKLPPYDQLVLRDHYPTSPVTSMEWALSRYKPFGFYDAAGNAVTRKALAYVKTDTENPKTFRYIDSLSSVLDSDTSRSIYSPKTFEKYVTDFTPNIADSGITRNTYSRYVEKYYPDAILSTKLTGSESTYAPVDEESSINRWNLINASATVIYDPADSLTGKTLASDILYKETTLGCVFDTSLLTTLTAQVTGNNTFINIDDLTESIITDEKFYVVDGSNITLYGNDELDSGNESYHAFYFDTANEVIASPAVLSAALLANPCLGLTPPEDTDDFRLYHSILESGIYQGVHSPSTWVRTKDAPLFYPDWMDSSGLIWSTTNNPSSILTPQNYPLSTIDTTRKTVFTSSNLLGKTFNFPDLPELGIGDREVFVANLTRGSTYGTITIEEEILNDPIETSRVQLFRTSHDLIRLLSKGNQLDIFGGLFDVFHHNNITRKDDYGTTPFDNPEPRLRGIDTTSYTNNADFYEEWNYSWNTDSGDGDLVGTETVSGGDTYVGDIEDVPTTYKQTIVRNYTFDPATSAEIAGFTDPYELVISYTGPGNTTVSGLTAAGFTLTFVDWYPLVEEVFTEVGSEIVVTLEEIARLFNWYVQVATDVGPSMFEIDPFNQSATDNIIYSTALEADPADTEFRHEKIRALYDDNHWPDGYASKNFTVVADDVIYDTENSNVAFAYHYGFERAFIDPLADTEGSNMDVAYDYYRYRFLSIEEDINNWLYVPYTDEVVNNVFNENNIATSEVTPEFMTYSFFIDRACDGLDQLIYGKDNNTFVERWKFPHAEEVLNNLEVTRVIDGIDQLVTLTNNGSGGYVDIQDYEIFKNGSLSVGKFTFPVIDNNLLIDGVENPLKEVIQKITTTSCQGITGAGVDWDELFTFLDANNDVDGKFNCYYPLSYDPYAGNSTFLPELPFFKEENTQFRFDNTKVSSTIRDKAAVWPWTDLLQGSSLNKPVVGDYTWQFTTDNRFWLAEVITSAEADGVDPLERTITNDVYGDDLIGREVYRIRGYEFDGKLFFDYTLTYDEHSGPELEVTPQVASDFNMFGQELKTKTIELEHFNTRPVNGPTQIDFLNQNEDVWHATQWNHFAVDLPKDLYRYRERDLCGLITDSFNKGTVPDNGKLCEIEDISQVWIYSVPHNSLNLPGTPVNDGFWIEENPLAVTAFTSGSPSGYYDLGNDIVENIITLDTVNTSAAPIGSQIVYKTAYTRSAGTNALRYSRALITGPSSNGLGMFGFGKSQAYGGSLLHYGDRENVKYSAADTSSAVPGYDTLKASWPWNVIGTDGELGPKGYTDTVDISGNYWFAFGDADNLEAVEIAETSDTDFKASYIIGMISKDKLEDFKVSLMDTNYIRANDTLNLLNLSEDNPDYIEFSLLDAENFGARLREGILEVVNSMNGEDFFELFVYLIDENVIDVDQEGNEDEKDIAATTTTENISGATTLPLPPLALGANPPEIVQDLLIVSSEDPTCLLCEVCDELTTNYQDLENPSVWEQHNHDEWVAPWLESPFSGPYHSDGFNVWLTAGTTNKWGTQVWAKLQNGKVWLSYKRQRIHADKVRGHVALQVVTGTISMEDFATIEDLNLNIPVYCTYDEFLFNYDDYAELDVIKKIDGDIDGTVYRYGIDCEDSFTVYNPIAVGTSPVSSCSLDPSGCLTEGISGTFICPDLTPNEVYTEWATSFVQEYKERARITGSDLIGKYYFKYDVNNTRDTNTFLTPESITDKEIVEYDWRRYQDGVGIGGSAPLVNLLSDDDVRCATLRECHIGQKAFGSTDKAVLSGGFVVPADGEVTLEDGWWSRFTTRGAAKWNTSVISPEDSLNENYRHRSLSPFFSNGVQTNSRLSLGYLMFDLGKEALVERQGIANFNQQSSVQVTFVDEIPDFFANNDKYSIVLQPDQNVKAWWADKTATGFTINVELDSWTGNIDWQVTLIDSIPPEEIDGISDDETFDKWDDL